MTHKSFFRPAASCETGSEVNTDKTIHMKMTRNQISNKVKVKRLNRYTVIHLRVFKNLPIREDH